MSRVQSSVTNNVTDLLKALLGKGSVNMPATHVVNNSTVEMFSMWSALRNSRGAVFSAWSVPRLYNESLARRLDEKIGIGRTEWRTMETGELELENWVGIPRWLKKKWQAYFIMIWNDSSCIEIRCQDTTMETENPSACVTVNWGVLNQR
jgi:hypothetical protein